MQHKRQQEPDRESCAYCGRTLTEAELDEHGMWLGADAYCDAMCAEAGEIVREVARADALLDAERDRAYFGSESQRKER